MSIINKPPQHVKREYELEERVTRVASNRTVGSRESDRVHRDRALERLDGSHEVAGLKQRDARVEVTLGLLRIPRHE